MSAHPGKACLMTAATVTRDHVFPLSKGGGLVIIVCRKCNHEKADMSPYEWIEYLFASGQIDRGDRAVRAYSLVKGVFRLGVSPEDVLDAIDAFTARPMTD